MGYVPDCFLVEFCSVLLERRVRAFWLFSADGNDFVVYLGAEELLALFDRSNRLLQLFQTGNLIDKAVCLAIPSSSSSGKVVAKNVESKFLRIFSSPMI